VPSDAGPPDDAPVFEWAAPGHGFLRKRGFNRTQLRLSLHGLTLEANLSTPAPPLRHTPTATGTPLALTDTPLAYCHRYGNPSGTYRCAPGRHHHCSGEPSGTHRSAAHFSEKLPAALQRLPPSPGWPLNSYRTVLYALMVDGRCRGRRADPGAGPEGWGGEASKWLPPDLTLPCRWFIHRYSTVPWPCTVQYCTVLGNGWLLYITVPLPFAVVLSVRSPVQYSTVVLRSIAGLTWAHQHRYAARACWCAGAAWAR